MFGSRRRVHGSLLFLMITAMIATGCGGGDPPAAPAGGLEKPALTIGMLPLPEVAPIQIGIDKGFFRAEGLTVEIELIQGGAAAMPDLLSGNLDVLHSNYVSAVLAATGAAKLKILAEAYVAKPGNFLLMTKKGSPITTIGGLRGKKIGVNTLNNVATLSTSVLLKTHGLTPADVKFIEQPFAQMAGALDSGLVDAAFMPEPFHQAAAKSGAGELSEVFTGPAADFPISGYLTTEQFAKDNPKTVAAFRRGLLKATRLAISDSAEVDAALLKYTKIDKATAGLMRLGGFSESTDPARVQRVADLMLSFGYLKEKIDVSSMILPGEPS
ncbi:ABC transporter substrate-binding protein [Nonomuraea sp. NPDC002799]